MEYANKTELFTADQESPSLQASSESLQNPWSFFFALIYVSSGSSLFL